MIRGLLLAVALLIGQSQVKAEGISPSGCPSCIQNSAAPQNAQMNIGTATVRGTLAVSTITATYANFSNLNIGALSGNGSSLTNLNASALTSGIVAAARLVGNYTGITGVGTIVSGIWNGSIIGTQYGGTGQNFSATNQGHVPYFSATGTMATLAPGTPQALLQTGGAGANPTWTSSPTIIGTNISNIPPANLLAGNLPTNVAVNDASISTVSAVKVQGNISGGASFLTVPLPVSNLAGGTLPTSNAASSITVNGVTPGVYGGPTTLAQVDVHADGRVYNVSQSSISLPLSALQGGTLPGSINVPAASINPGALGAGVIASSLTTTGVGAGSYGAVNRTVTATVRADGRLSAIASPLIALPLSQLNAGSLPGTITVPAASIESGSLGNGVIASSIAANGVTPGTYGSATQTSQFTVGYDGRITAAASFPVAGASTVTAYSNRDNNWSHSQTFQASVTVNSNLFASNIAGNGSAITNLTLGNVTGLQPIISAIGVSTAALEAEKVNRAGDTMTGALNMTNVPIVLTGTAGYVTSASTVTASYFVGNGGGITGLTATACTAGAGTNSVLCQGNGNAATGFDSTVAGGDTNSATAGSATVGGGFNNHATAPSATVGGGDTNAAGGTHSTIAGGNQQTASGRFSSIGGGSINYTPGTNATIAGGELNTASGLNSSIGGGSDNTVDADSGTISGGALNEVHHGFGVVAGGLQNVIAVGAPSIGGTISGGQGNTIGGSANDYSVIGGGYSNVVNAYGAGICSGGFNYIDGAATNGTIAGGYSNRVWKQAGAVSGGDTNNAYGYFSTIPGGQRNSAYGQYSYAGGFRAIASADGSYAISDSQDADFVAVATNSYNARFGGGYNVTAPSITVVGGNVVAVGFYGDGSHLTGIPDASTVNVTASMYGNGSVGSPLGVNSSSVAVLNASGFVPNAELDPSSITKQGLVTLANLSGAVPSGRVDFSTITTALATKASSGTNTNLISLGALTSITSTLTSPLTVSGTSVTANAFFGDGSHLSGVTDISTVNVTAALTGNGSIGSPLGVNSSSVAVLNASGFVPNSELDPSSVTKQGLVTLANLSGAVPSGRVDFSTITTALATKASSGTNNDITSLGALTAINSTLTAPLTVSGTSVTANAFFGDGSHLTGIAATVSVTAALTGNGSSGSPIGVNSSSIAVLNTSGFVPNAELDPSSITKQGLVSLANLSGAVPSGRVDFSTITTQFNSVASATTTIYAALNSTASYITTQFNSVAVSTTANQAAINSTAAYATSQFTSVASATTTIYAALNSTASFATNQFNAVAVATTTNGASITTLSASTAALAAQFITNSSSETNTSAGGLLAKSSMTANAFFGDASHMTGYVISASSYVAGGQNINSITFVGVATTTIVMRGSRSLTVRASAYINNGSAGSRTYNCQIQQNGVLVNDPRQVLLTNASLGIMYLEYNTSSSPSGSNTYSMNCNSSSATGTQTSVTTNIVASEF